MSTITLNGSARLRELARELRATPAQLAKAQKLAAASTARKGQTLMRRAIKQKAPLPQREVINRLVKLRAKPGEWVLGTKIYAGISVVYYPHRRVRGGPRGRGIRVRFAPGGAQVNFPHAFEVASRMTKWGPMIFERTGAARYPIKVTSGPSVSDKFAETMGPVSREMETYYAAEMERQVLRLARAL